MYLHSKFVWAVNHFNNPAIGYDALNAMVDEYMAFMQKAKQYTLESECDRYAAMLLTSQMFFGTNCEFGNGRAEMTPQFAQNHLAFMEKDMNPLVWETLSPKGNTPGDKARITFLRTHTLPGGQAFDKGPFTDEMHDTFHLAWAQLAHRCCVIGREEYWRCLSALAERVMELPYPQNNLHLSYFRIQAALSAVAALCKYHSVMPTKQQHDCTDLADRCLQWLVGFSTKERMALGSLGDELNIVCTVAFSALCKREKALRVLRLSTESTYAHSVLCAEMATDLASAFMQQYPTLFSGRFPTLTNEEILDEIYVGALLHDIGKMEVSGPISQVIRTIFDEEFVQIKTHPTRGLRYLTEPSFACARACCAWHHEHFDGKGGYPLNYKDAEAEPFRFIVQLITFVDCYTSALDRYKSAYQPEKKPADVVEELAILSRSEKSEKYRKDEGRIIYNPIFSDMLSTSTRLDKYANEQYVTDWIEKSYYDAYTAFNS